MTEKKPAPPDKHMAKITLGFEDYVLPIAEATKVLQALEKAEKYQWKYRHENDGGPSHHVWAKSPRVGVEMITYETYVLAKLAGEPEDI